MYFINKIQNLTNENINTVLSTAKNSKLLIGGCVLWLVISLLIFFYIYNKHIKPGLDDHKLNKEFINRKESDNKYSILYFYTDWCPYCKSSKQEIEKFKFYIDEKKNEDFKIEFMSINCDKNQKLADQYNIESYPTLKIIHKKDSYDFDAKLTIDNLKQFLDSVIYK
tara:strand:+ start:1378 stop:1878 length:501 start_codon:yes stop_codon:yes gene_type:complete